MSVAKIFSAIAEQIGAIASSNAAITIKPSDSGIHRAIAMSITHKLSFEDYLALDNTGYEGDN